MSNIITPDQLKTEACQREITQVLKKHGMALEPVVIISASQGIKAMVNLRLAKGDSDEIRG